MANIEKRVAQNGDISYRVKVRLAGFPTETATFARITDAKRWAQETETRIRDGRYFKTAAAKKHTLAETIDRYIKNVLPNKPKSINDQTPQLNWWKEQLGQYALANISPALLSECRDKLAGEITVRSTKRSPATVNRYMAALSHVFSVATKEWGWTEDNPFAKVTKMKEPRGRVRFLSESEREKLFEACKQSQSEHLYLAVLLCLATGARKMEIMGLKWQDVDFQRGVIVLHETKNGERRVLPLTGKALTALKEFANVAQGKSSDLIFPSKTDPKKPIDIRTPWENALKNAEITDFRFHDLRHSTASYLAMNGATLAEIAEVLGHKTLNMVKRYAHLSEAHTMKVVESMNRRIFGND